MIHNTGGRKTGDKFNTTLIVDYTNKKNELSNTLETNQAKFGYKYEKKTAQ